MTPASCLLGVLLDVDLQALARLREMREPSLAHAAQGLNSPGDPDSNRRRRFLRGVRGIFSQNGGDRVAEFEALAVGPETQRFDLANPPEALLQQLVFQGQIILLGEFGYYKVFLDPINLHYHSSLQRREAAARHATAGDRISAARRLAVCRDSGGGRWVHRWHRAGGLAGARRDRKSTRLNSSHLGS